MQLIYKMRKAFFLSGFFSFFWSVIFLMLSRVLDKFIPHSVSTLLSSMLTSIGNFFVQYYIFTKDHMSFNHVMKYSTLAVIETLSITLVAHVLIKNRVYIDKKLEKVIADIKKEWNQYYSTIARTVAGILCFVVISYPLRKKWVFS